MMRAGWLKHRITIQMPATEQSASGEVTPGWSDFLSAWASIEPLRGREYMEGRQAQASVDHRIRMRYRDGITPDMQVVFGSRTFQIVSVINVIEGKRELNLMCRENVG
jgi:SPP1 family predicted phage head-tail adaptor